MTLDLTVFDPYWLLIAKGLGVTVALSASALVVAIVLGVVVALARLSRFAGARWLALAYIETFRNTPFMIQLFLAFYVLPFFGLRLPAFAVGVVALSAYGAAYYAEIIRGAILSVPRGQMDSARSVGMSYTQAMRHVVFPQMLGYLIPPATNQTLLLIKESSITSTITITELTMAAQIIQGNTYSPVEVFLLISLLYWALCTSVARAGQRLELALQPYARGRGATRPAGGALDLKSLQIGR